MKSGGAHVSTSCYLNPGLLYTMHTLRFHMILMHDQQNPLTTYCMQHSTCKNPWNYDDLKGERERDKPRTQSIVSNVYLQKSAQQIEKKGAKKSCFNDTYVRLLAAVGGDPNNPKETSIFDMSRIRIIQNLYPVPWLDPLMYPVPWLDPL